MELLLAHGANPNAINENKETPIFGFSLNGYHRNNLKPADQPLIELLLEYGARTLIKDSNGKIIANARLISNFTCQRRKQLRLLGLLKNKGKKGYSPFNALPREILEIIIRLVHPEKVHSSRKKRF